MPIDRRNPRWLLLVPLVVLGVAGLVVAVIAVVVWSVRRTTSRY